MRDCRNRWPPHTRNVQPPHYRAARRISDRGGLPLARGHTPLHALSQHPRNLPRRFLARAYAQLLGLCGTDHPARVRPLRRHRHLARPSIPRSIRPSLKSRRAHEQRVGFYVLALKYDKINLRTFAISARKIEQTHPSNPHRARNGRGHQKTSL